MNFTINLAAFAALMRVIGFRELATAILIRFSTLAVLIVVISTATIVAILLSVIVSSISIYLLSTLCNGAVNATFIMVFSARRQPMIASTLNKHSHRLLFQNSTRC